MSNTYEILVNPDGGWITPFGVPTEMMSPTGIVTVNEGESITFEMEPCTDGVIDDVIVDGVSVGSPSTYTFENINSNHSIRATFVY